MLKELELNERFTLKFRVKKMDQVKVDKILSQAEFPAVKWARVPFDNFLEFRLDVNIRKAELVRQLLKNITVYD